MYDRQVGDKTLDFDTSGSLYYSALVMQDDQTDSFWAIMMSEAIGGDLQGKKLRELPISIKTTWSEWRGQHPNTLVLSVEGVTHIDRDPYANYFTNDKLFGGELADPDTRLDQKASIYAFSRKDRPFAIPHKSIYGGWQGKAGRDRVFIYRGKDDSLYRSSSAWIMKHQGKPIKLQKEGDQWAAKDLGAFDVRRGQFENGAQMEAIPGWDTFWYIWSQYYSNDKGKLLDR